MSQFEILKPFINERISSLVRGRLLEGTKFFKDGVIAHEFSRSEVKLSLMLVRIANPTECFTADELHILKGRQKVSTSANPVCSSETAGKTSASKKRKKGV